MKVSKQEFVAAYFNSGRSLRKTAKALGINPKTAIEYFHQVKHLIEATENNLVEKILSNGMLAIFQNAEKLKNGDDKAIDREYRIIEKTIPIYLERQKSTHSVANTAFSDMLGKIKKQLTPYQVSFDESQKRFKGILSSTKAGKTFFGIYEILKNAFSANPKVAVWWVAPIYMQAEIAHKRISFMLRENNVTAKISKSPLKIEIDGHAPIFFKSADNPDSLYGEDVAFAIFDEFTRASSDAWTAIVSTLTATGGRCTLIGNYITSVNWGVKMVQKNAEKFPNEWDFFKVTAWQAVEAGVLKREVVEQAQRELHPFIFAALYLAEGSADKQALFNNDDVERLFVEKQADGERYISADIALLGSDFFVIMVWQGFRVIEVLEFHKTDGKEVVEILESVKTRYGVNEANIVFDGDGNGAYVSGFFPLAKKFHGGGKSFSKVYANMRARCYYELSLKLKAGEVSCVIFENSEKLKDELLAIRGIEQKDNGRFIIENKKIIAQNIGNSPDRADALMMRMYIEIAPKNNFA